MIGSMQTPDTSPLINWIAASLRWLVLLSMAVSLALRAPLPPVLTAALILVAVWNILQSTLAAANRRIAAHPFTVVLSDALIAWALFYLSGLLNGGLGWAGLLPVFSASLYFQYPGALIASVVSALGQGLLASLQVSTPAAVLFAITLLPLYLFTGLLVSFLGKQLVRRQKPEPKSAPPEPGSTASSDQERRRAIFNLLSALSSTLNYQRVLDTAVEMSASALLPFDPTAAQLVSAAFLFQKAEPEETVLALASATGIAQADFRTTLPGTSGLLGRTIDEGVAQHARDLSSDPELGQLISLHACNSAYCIPLRTGLDTCGVLLFAHPKASFFSPEIREVLDLVGKQATAALDNASLYQDLAQEKERMMELQEETRKKMASDLHDGPTQSVAAMAMRVNFARRLIERDPKAAAEELYKIEDLAHRTTKEIRHMLFTLRPLVLESQGLIPALQSMADKMAETYNQKVLIQADPSLVERLEMNKQGVIFYLAEEAVNNARKHAQAEHIWVALKQVVDGLAMLEIADDGVGFDVEAVKASYESRTSLGMVNMRERTELLNGRLNILSSPGHGTRVQVFIPLNEETADRLRRGL